LLTSFENKGRKFPRYRSTAISTESVVASSHPLATLSGLRILERGGNAFDAAIATNTTLNVTQPHLCGIGGDVFYLLYESKTGKVHFLNGSGRAGERATIDRFREKGFSQIPTRGLNSVVTVPGCVDGWREMLDRFGSGMPTSQLLKDAIKYAGEGHPISHQLSSSIFNIASQLSVDRNWAKIFMPEGFCPKPGYLLRQTELAQTFSELAEHGLDSFYNGPITDKLCRFMEENDGLITRNDLKRNESNWYEPISCDYRGYTVYETPPNSQALTALCALNFLEPFNIKDMDLLGPEYMEIMLNAMSYSYQLRDRFITDPWYMEADLGELISKWRARKEAVRFFESTSKLIEPLTVVQQQQKLEGDTTYFAIVDKDRNCVSCIQSLYFGFGSGVVVPGTGIVLQNRGSYFSLDPKHHNSLKPGKRTFHTLCASLTVKDDRPSLVFGSMGGDVQPQIHQQVISSFLDFGLDIQEAIEMPRWIRGGTIYQPEEVIHVESRFPSKTLEYLKGRGYNIRIESDLYVPAGHAQGIAISDDGGCLFGGADPRGDGIALGT
jgi:gamma-glutamyltranspeptidase